MMDWKIISLDNTAMLSESHSVEPLAIKKGNADGLHTINTRVRFGIAGCASEVA